MQTPFERLTSAEHLLLNELIETRFGLSFGEEKRALLEGRLRPRLLSLGLRKFIDYYLLLKFDFESEATQLAHLLTNNESYFFRETYQFESLFADGPELLAGNGSPAWKILCAGCSSGEEAFTLNIFARESGRIDTTVDAFDLDTDRVRTALQAQFGRSSLRALDESAVNEIFRPQVGDLHELRPRFREGTSFTAGNILNLRTYPTQGPYDVLFCRNVLIYFSERALLTAIQNFAEMLRPGGLLFLGHSESIIGLTDLFETVRLSSCIAYRKVEEK